ncbi:MAG: energy transducer TonB [Fimbriimonadales bacterium]
MAILQRPSNSRFTAALLGSLLLNIVLWGAMAAGASRVAPIPPARLMEVTRVEIDKDHKQVPKVVKHIVPVEIKHKVEEIQHKTAPPKPVAHPQPPPPAEHSHVITAPAKAGQSTNPDDFTAKSGGTSAPGKPVEHQGTAETKPPDPPKAEPPKAEPPKPDPPKPDPPKPDPPKPDPPKPDPPKPKGATKDSEPVSQIQPEIPDSLKSQDLKTFVRVRVEIAEDGNFEVILRTSSGNPEVDRLVLNALKKWKWKPALKDGEPVKSTQLFKFEIEVK